jgi:hypothetical protein
MLASLIRWLEILAFGVFTYELMQSAFWVARLMMLRMLPLALFGLAFGTSALWQPVFRAAAACWLAMGCCLERP